MPLGDPGGGNFEYTTEGLPSGAAFIEIPVKDKDRALAFYRDVLMFRVVQDDPLILSAGSGCSFVLTERNDAGKETGIYLKVDNPFDFNRRMVDEGVVMVRHPQKGALGVYASFRDSEGNTLHVIS